MLSLFSVSLFESWKNDRNLLRILEQERRRRLVPPDEDELLSRNPPLFARPYKVMGVECRLEGEKEEGLGWERRAVFSAWTVADLSLIPANTASSRLLH